MLAWSPRSPGLPLITARAGGARLRAALLKALEAVAHDPALAPALRTLRLQGFHALPEAHYFAALAHEQMAADLGYPDLV